jgi:prepilin-type N-terminal cleavage/methylation domain-containing protein
MKNADTPQGCRQTVRAARGMSFRVSNLGKVELKESRAGHYAKSSGRRSTGIMASRKQNGFSMLEMIIAISVSLILAGAVTLTMQATFRQQLVNDAYNTTLTTLRRARDQSAADMRVYVVSFATATAGNGGTITVTQNTPAGAILFTANLPQQVTYHLEPGLPNTIATTPDGFGTATSIFDFDQAPSGAGGGTVIYFQPDGSAQDAAGNVNNGVVYLGTPGNLQNQRAVTLWGYTGRVRGWQLVSVGGVWSWIQS